MPEYFALFNAMFKASFTYAESIFFSLDVILEYVSPVLRLNCITKN